MPSPSLTPRKKERNKTKRSTVELQNEINELDRKICNDQCLDTSTLNRYEEAKKQLKDIYMYDTKGREICNVLFQSPLD